MSVAASAVDEAPDLRLVGVLERIDLVHDVADDRADAGTYDHDWQCR